MNTFESIFAPFQALLDPETFNGLMAAIGEMRRQHGDKWQGYFNAEFPDFVLLIDLAANKTAAEALPLFRDYAISLVDDSDMDSWMKAAGRLAASGWVRGNSAWLTDMHGRIRAEIDKPRF